MNNIG